MDQTGSFAHSDIPFGLGAPDLALSFAEPAVPLDPQTGTITVDICSHVWQWFSRIDGFVFHRALKLIGFRYAFDFNEDYSFAQVYPSVFWGSVFVPSWLMSFTMVRQTPDPKLCPPAKGATKQEIAKCAHWDRVSSGLLSPLMGHFGVVHYYVFQIVDGKGNRVRPYYDAYLDFAS